ncbi:hypothetical protein EZS27_018664 [termite gut metagenome]|uniref:Nuclease associated modular domain-containing protein n=1 Tax=termite gut metagenome TaxID=433724 RepID=A0A5J4RGU6_9ZZZZ
MQNIFHILSQNKLKNIVINVIIHKNYLSLYKNSLYMMKIYGQSPEHIEKRAQANRGKKRTPEQRENIKAGLRAYWSNYVPIPEATPEVDRESQPDYLTSKTYEM